MRAFNFNAGPGALPVSVLQQMADEMLNFRGTGMSVSEMSHRSAVFVKVVKEAEEDLRKLLSVPKNYKVLFMTGGGTAQFAAVPLNLFPSQSCSYLVSGTWSKAAATEGAKFATVAEITDWKHFQGCDSRFVYVCTNETVNGILFDPVELVKPDQILIADMSSEILTRTIDVSKYGLIFAGAQKNIGIAGVTVVIVREDLIANPSKQCPIVFDYSVTAKNDSLYNTPPCSAIYAAGLVFKWALQEGGVAALEQQSKHKAKLVYDALEQHSDTFKILIEPQYRSRTNVVFRTVEGESGDKRFVSEAEKEGMVGLAGHRSVGGIRASLYNAVPLQHVEHLVLFIHRFASKK